MDIRPIDVAVALSLYGYNVSPYDRARAIYDHFEGMCAEMDDLMAIMQSQAVITELAPPSALVYVDQAIERYGQEAKESNIAYGI